MTLGVQKVTFRGIELNRAGFWTSWEHMSDFTVFRCSEKLHFTESSSIGPVFGPAGSTGVTLGVQESVISWNRTQV